MTMRIMCVLALFLAGCTCPCQLSRTVDADAPYRVGVNFIQIGSAAPSSSYSTASSVLADLEVLGAGGIRLLNANDLSWFTTYEGGDPYSTSSYDFSDAEDLVCTGRVYAVPTLFQQGSQQPDTYFAENPVTGSSDFNYERFMYTPNGEDLADIVVDTDGSIIDDVWGYAATVAELFECSHQHFEIGNELIAYPGYPAEAYGHLLGTTFNAIATVDLDLRIVLGGLAGTTDGVFHNNLEWMEEVFDTLNRDHDGARTVVDVVSFHYYDGYADLREAVIDLREVLERYDWEGPIWATELGRSHVAYTGSEDPDEGPHEPGDSEDEQAADVFRLFSVAFGAGVELCNWHTYISGTENPRQTWSGFGLRRSNSGDATKAYYSFQLFAERLGRFATCREVSGGDVGKGEIGQSGVWAYLYRVPGDTASKPGGLQPASFGSHRWVIWTDDPAGATFDLAQAAVDLGLRLPSPIGGERQTVSVKSVVPDSSGAFTSSVVSRNAIPLSTTPVLIEEIASF